MNKLYVFGVSHIKGLFFSFWLENVRTITHHGPTRFDNNSQSIHFVCDNFECCWHTIKYKKGKSTALTFGKIEPISCCLSSYLSMLLITCYGKTCGAFCRSIFSLLFFVCVSSSLEMESHKQPIRKETRKLLIEIKSFSLTFSFCVSFFIEYIVFIGSANMDVNSNSWERMLLIFSFDFVTM